MCARTLVSGALLAAMAIGVGGSLPLAARESRDEKAEAVMKAAREALGGDKQLSRLTALSLRADFRREAAAPGASGGALVIMRGGGAGGGQMTGTIAIDILFPDRFYREETTSSGFALTRIDGFEGERAFFDISSANPGARIQAPRLDDPARMEAALRRANADVARLLLGLIAGTHASLPVTYTHAGEAESADAVADIIDVAGANGFKARLFVDSATHLPLMLTYVEPEARMQMMTSVRGGPAAPDAAHGAARAGGATPPGAARGAATRERRPGEPPALTPEERAEIEERIRAAEAEPPKLVEYRLYFADYREVGGLLLPHRISRGNEEKTLEEWEIRKYEVNPRIKADRFNVGRE